MIQYIGSFQNGTTSYKFRILESGSLYLNNKLMNSYDPNQCIVIRGEI